VRAESKSFLQRVFKGAAAPMLAHFCETADLTPEQIEELRLILNRKSPNKKSVPCTTPTGIKAALTAARGAQAPALLDAPQLEQALTHLKNNGAQFISSPRGITLSGTRAAVEAVREMRYPTGWQQSPKTPGAVVPVTFETRNVGGDPSVRGGGPWKKDRDYDRRSGRQFSWFS
jgi:hypothetical protein